MKEVRRIKINGTPNRMGLIYAVLKAIAEYGINIITMESDPYICCKIEWDYPMSEVSFSNFMKKRIPEIESISYIDLMEYEAIAKMLDKTIVDGDYAGRAIPEIFQISLMTEDINFCPAVSFDKYGNVCIMKNAVSLTLAERIGKYLSEVSFGSTALAGFPVTGKQLKRLLVRGSISKAYEVGRLLDQAKIEKGILASNLKTAGMKRIFRGIITKKEWKDEAGYYMGIHTLKGTQDFEGHELKMYFKNETHIAWIDDEYIASSPDLICTIEPNLIKPMRNDDIIEGDEIEVYVTSCDPILKVDKVIKYLEPKYFGFDINYKEI